MTTSIPPTDLSPESIQEGLAELARFIQDARNEIANIHPADISNSHIPLATDELDAVVGATEEATNKIMDICDEISALAPSCAPETGEKLINCTTRLFEACNFQDITGQRITKVVQTLKHIDAKVAALLKIFGDEVSVHKPVTQLMTDDASLLNGPQLPQNAVDQDAIDRLLSDF